tara:strand:- start:422 stop:2884 length:2463 start_codon:yes stop_codon:yes gene_type:complete
MSLTQINKAGLDEIALDHVFTIGASGTNHYTFQGEGLNGTVNDPTLYLTRGKTYRFENTTGAHAIRIQSADNGTSGTLYNTGVTNNNTTGTVIVEVQHDAPDVLYYQCASHANMKGTIYVTGALADDGVTTAKIADDAVTTAKIADLNVTTAKIASNAITTGTIMGSAVTTAKIANDAVTSDKIASNAITTAKIANDAVTGAKIAAEIDNSHITSTAAIAATKLSYTQSDTGATARTIDSKLEDFVSVKDFGATGDGSTNDATAFNNALATEKAVYVPAGTYVLNSTITIGDKNVTMFGDGERLSILKFTGGTDGLYWSSSDDTHSLVLEKLQFQASATMSGSPVDANFSVSSGSIRPGVSLENIVAAPTGSGAWTQGFKFNNCRNSNIVECIHNGVYGTTQSGFIFAGQCLDVKAERCQANDIGASTGAAFTIGGTCEGVQISSALVINTKIGVDHATPSMEPYLSVIGSHFNTRQFGVRISKSEQSIISNNLFYADTENPTACEDYIGVELLANADNDFNSITDNVFHGERVNNTSGTQTERGVRVQHGDSNLIANNVFHDFTTGISVFDVATNTQLSDNRYESVTSKESYGDTSVVSLRAEANRYIVGGHGNKDVQLELKSGTDGFKLSSFSDGSAGIESTNNDVIRFFTNGEKLRILSGGGITFNGDTAAANALDDYEEGQYQPTPTGDSGQTDVSVYSGENTLNYTKIGNLVNISGRLRMQTVSYSGGLRITLPFTAESNTNTSNASMAAVATHGADFDSTAGTGSHMGMFLEVGGGTAYAYFVVTRDNSAWIGANNSIIKAGTYLTFTYTYRAA